MTEQKTTHKEHTLDRRDFLKLTATTGAIAALSSIFPWNGIGGLVEKGSATAASQTPQEDVWIKSACNQCAYQDAIKVHRVNGVAVKVEGDPDGIWQSRRGRFHPICANGQAGLQRIYDPWRAKAPLKRTNPEKGFGVDPKWVEISWDEAYDTIANKIKEVRAKGADGVWAINASGHSSSYGGNFSSAIVPADAVSLDMGMAWCEMGHYTTVSMSGGWVMCADYGHDYTNTKLLLQTNSSRGVDASGAITQMAGNFQRARQAGMRLVNIMPILCMGAAKADEWIPTAPATEGAFVLGMVNVLLYEAGIIDAEFIKNVTNGPYLIGPDGYYVRDQKSQKPLVWDPVDNAAKVFDDKTVKDYALEGTFTIEGTQYTPAFQLVKQSVKDYTPEWAAKICDASAQDIRRIANEWGQTASVGQKITIDGVEHPYRPVALDGFIGSGTGHAHGIASSALPHNLLCSLVGANGVPGAWHTIAVNPISSRNWTKPTIRVEDGLNGPLQGNTSVVPFKYPPESPSLDEFFPIATMNGWLTSLRMAHPDKYKYGAATSPKADFAWLRKANPLVMNYATGDLVDLYATLPFIVSLSDLIDETGEYSDIIIPERTTYEWLQLPSRNYVDINSVGWLNQPVITPLYGLPDTLDIYMEICARAGVLYGKGGFNDSLNGSIRAAEDKLDLNTRYTPEQVMDRMCKKAFGADKGLDWAKQNGGIATYVPIVYEPWNIRDGAAASPTFPRRLPIYLEFQKHTGDDLAANMKKAGVEWDVSDYSALPRWIPSHIHKDTPPYDLVLIPHRKAGFSATSSMSIPFLLETALNDPYACYAWMNEDTGKAKGLKDGDVVWIESVQDKVQAVVKLSQGIHPKAVGVCINLGGWASNEVLKSFWQKHLGIPYMKLRPWGFEYADMMVGNLENTIKVKVYKA
jgi:anaerobic selenocysteine-containing dehydrogenase